MVTVNAKTKKAVFQLELPEAQSVSLMGDFNQWDEAKNVMKKNKDGVWKSELKLAPGEYQFLYYVDKSRWITDDQCPHTTSNVGTENSIAIIPAKPVSKSPSKKKRVVKKK